MSDMSALPSEGADIGRDVRCVCGHRRKIHPWMRSGNSADDGIHLKFVLLADHFERRSCRHLVALMRRDDVTGRTMASRQAATVVNIGRHRTGRRRRSGESEYDLEQPFLLSNRYHLGQNLGQRMQHKKLGKKNRL
jgi:hypothetical protein